MELLIAGFKLDEEINGGTVPSSHTALTLLTTLIAQLN